MPRHSRSLENNLTKNSYRRIWSSNCCYKVSYNNKSQRLWPSSICMTIWLTCLLIFVLSAASLYFGIIAQILKDEVPVGLIVVYVILFVVDFGTMLQSFRSLFNCAQTEPGILPGSNYFGSTIATL